MDYMTTIILAAGLSSRMGENKLLLPFNGSTILETTLKTVLPFSDRTLIVVGHDSNKIKKLLEKYPVEFVDNPRYREGQRSSTLLGIESVLDDDFMVLPGDLPLIKNKDIEGTITLLSRYTVSRAIYKGIPGHPVAYRKENREKLLAFPGTMKEYLEAFDCGHFQASIGAIFDIDTPNRYEALLLGNYDSIIFE